MKTVLCSLLAAALAFTSEPVQSWPLEITRSLLEIMEIQRQRTKSGKDLFRAKIETLSEKDKKPYETRMKNLLFRQALLESSSASLYQLLVRWHIPVPDQKRVPEDVHERIRGFSYALPQGGAGRSDGFARACPADGFSLDPGESSGLIRPAGGMISAGTWQYPGGGLHLGMDLASGLYSPVRAPADGVILYAHAPTGDAGGYLGNWSGWPYGGGNTISMIGTSVDTLYAISFFHLSSRLQVIPSQQVRQGDIIAYSGNSGNSTGPHTHIELFEIRASFEEAVRYFQKTADFSFGTGWDQPGTCSPMACRLRPEPNMMKELTGN